MSAAGSGGAKGTDLDAIMKNFRLKTKPTASSTVGEDANGSAPASAAVAASSSVVVPPVSSTGSSPAILSLEQILAQHKHQQHQQSSVVATPSSAALFSVDPAAPPPVEEFLSLVNRQLAILLDGSSSAPVRRSSFESLKRVLCDSALPASHAVPAHKAALKPLLKRFGDEREWCRASAITLVTASVRLLPHLADYLHYILPVLAYRMGTIDLTDAPVTLGSNTHVHERKSANPNDVTPQTQYQSAAIAVAAANAAAHTLPASSEQSSEIRAQLLRVLHELLLRCSNRELDVFLPDICQILYTSMQTDRAPEIKILVCDALTLLCDDYAHAMRAFSRVLMLPLMQRVLLDKSSSVRVSAVRAVGRLIPCGAAEQLRDLCAFREHNVIDIHGFFHGEQRVHYLARLVADPNRAVRAEFFRVVNAWSVDLYERADYETLIMPYVFSGLSDPDAGIQSMGLATMSRAGSDYEREEKERLASGVGGNAMDEGAFRLKLLAEEESRKYLTSLGAPLLFAPFTTRPPWGERQIARKFLDRLLHAVLTEKADWKRDVAEKSWTLLRVLLVYAEEHITQYTTKFLKAFHSDLLATHAQRETPFQAMWDCAALVGRYTDPAILLGGMATEIRASGGEKLRSAVRVASHAIRHMAHTHVNFLSSLDAFVTAVLVPDLYLSLEHDLFVAVVELLASILNQTVSHGFLARHGERFFRAALELGAWRRTTLRHNAAATQDTVDPMRSSLDACYSALQSCVLRSMDEEEDASSSSDLLFLFQLHLLPVVREWNTAAATAAATTTNDDAPHEDDVATWTEATMRFGMLLEVIEHVGAGGIFVAPEESETATESTPPPPTLDTPQQIAAQLESLILRVLSTNHHLPVHAALLSALVPALQQAGTDSVTGAKTRFTSRFLSDAQQLIGERVNEFRARFPTSAHAQTTNTTGLARLTREEERQLEAQERARLALRHLMKRLEDAAEQCICLAALQRLEV